MSTVSRTIALALMTCALRHVVSGAENPVRVGSLQVPDFGFATPHEVVIQGHYAFVAYAAPGLVVVDVQDPTAPVEVGRYNTAGAAQGVTISGDYAYVADFGAGLQIMDVSDPSAPRHVGTYKNGSGNFAWQSVVIGNLAYVSYGASGLEIVDISTPTTPRRVGRLATGDTIGLAVSGAYAYVANLSSGLRVVDVRDPAKPVQVGLIKTSNAIKVAVAGSYAYVADFDAGLKVIDVSNPAAPKQVGSIGTGADARHVTVFEGRAYVSDSAGGVKVIDVSNPAALKQVGSYKNSQFPNAWAMASAATGGYLYLAQDFGVGLEILRLPSSPPALSISRLESQVTVSWASAATGYLLEAKYHPGAETTWSPVTNAVATEGDRFVVTNEVSAGTTLFRLRRP